MLLHHLVILAIVVASTVTDAQLCKFTTGLDIILTTIAETFPINTSLSLMSNITGTDAQITLVAMPSDYFKFDSSTRSLISQVAFNVTGETTMRIYVNLTCTILSPRSSMTLQILIQVTDMNNNAPYFVDIPYSVNISERTAVNMTVFQGVKAVDADPCDLGYLRYSVQDDGNPYSSYFSFPVWSVGTLVLTKKLDYETVQTINLTIIVMDNGNNITIMGQLQPQHTATTTMIINIIPGDDYNPMFSQSTYNGALVDNTLQGRSVTIFSPVAASIKYARPGEQVVYSILQDANNADGSNFVINNQTGVITVSPVINSGAYQFAFQIQATKLNETYRYGTALVRLNVIRSAQPLIFTQRTYSADVDEDEPNGTLVATVVAIDGGQQRPTYSFTGQVADFTINSQTGEIRTARELSYGANPLYNLSVLAKNSNSTDTCIVILTITKSNIYNPRFIQSIYTFNVSNASNSVGLVQAVDQYPGMVLTYRLIDTSGLFTVDRTGHLVYSSSSFFSNSSSSHSLVVIAEDDGRPPRQDSALVVVSWGAFGVPEVPVPDALSSSAGEKRAYYIAVIVLGIIAGILILIVILLAVCLCTRQSLKDLWGFSLRPVEGERASKPDLDTDDSVSVQLIDYVAHRNGSQRRGKSKANTQPRVTIEVDRAPEKPRRLSSPESPRSVVGGFEVTKEYGPYLPYGPGESSTDDVVVVPSSSVLSSSDKLQKLRIYHSVPTDRSDPANRNSSSTDPRSVSQQSKKQPPTYPPYSSTSISTTSSPPSSRVERYKFEEESGSVHPSGTARPPRSASPARRAYQTPVPVVPHNSVPGPRRTSGRLQATVAGLRDSNSGDTSSTETLVTPVNSRAKTSNVSFVDNPAGYMSSQEGMDVSMSALTRTDGESGIIVYY